MSRGFNILTTVTKRIYFILKTAFEFMFSLTIKHRINKTTRNLYWNWHYALPVFFKQLLRGWDQVQAAY